MTFLVGVFLWIFIIRRENKNDFESRRHATWDPEANFCPECGKQQILDVSVQCPNGHKITQLANFCAICGTKVPDEERNKFFAI